MRGGRKQEYDMVRGMYFNLFFSITGCIINSIIRSKSQSYASYVISRVVPMENVDNVSNAMQIVILGRVITIMTPKMIQYIKYDIGRYN